MRSVQGRQEARDDREDRDDGGGQRDPPSGRPKGEELSQGSGSVDLESGEQFGPPCFEVVEADLAVVELFVELAERADQDVFVDPRRGRGGEAVRPRDPFGASGRGRRGIRDGGRSADDDPAGGACSQTQSAAVTAVPGAVFSGSADGGLRAYDARDGKIIWTFDANREFETINGVAARGASFDGPGPVVAGGMLYVLSGNAGFVGRPGNVLLAYSIDGK